MVVALAVVAMLVALAPQPATYVRRTPEKTPLYRVVQANLATLRRDAMDAESGRVLPRFVVETFERFLDCGILAKGFIRLHCPSCKTTSVVAFSCKGRGLCPSCAGRRMTETAALWLDRVLPNVGVRQWVLTVPVGLRFRLAFDPKLATMVLDAFVRALAASYRRRARLLGHGDGLCGGVTAIQRFSSSLQLNVHFHTLFLDGVYVPGERPGSLCFIPLPPPTDNEVGRTLDHARRLIERRLADRGLNGRGDPCAGPLADCAAASIEGIALLGPGAGLPLGRVVLPLPPQPAKPHGKRCVAAGGYSLHANTAVHALNRRRLEHLSRYVLRPPIANGRLHERADGRLEYSMKRTWRDGTVAVTFSPADFMSKLAALIPPPRANQVRYHGVLAPASPYRAKVVPTSPPVGPGQAPTCPAPRDRKSERTRRALGLPGDGDFSEPGCPGRAATARHRLLWAECMKRGMDPPPNCTAYVGCSGRCGGHASVSSVGWTAACGGQRTSQPAR